MAGKKRSYAKGKKKQEPITEETLARFGGSSDEEEDNNEDNDEVQDSDNEVDDDADADVDDDSGDDEAVAMKEPTSKKKKSKKARKVASQDDDDEDDEASDDDDGEEADKDDDDASDDDEDFDQYENEQRQKHGSAGMASAMSKILGTAETDDEAAAASKYPKSKKQKVSSTGSAVLSKTTTPLQRQLLAEKEHTKMMKEKRREKAIDFLPALHIPLSVATTSITLESGSKGVARELEQERLHRRVATRGVVALFNAVAQHQKKGPADRVSTVSSSKSGEKVKKMTKHGFLDMIKTAAVDKGDASSSNNIENDNSKTEKGASKSKGAQSGSKWAAIQDDYMLNPKKNWDQEEDSSDEEVDMSGDEASPAPEEVVKKARRVRR